MHVAGIAWYNANEGRNFPIEDLASLSSTSGEVLPTDLIVDLNVSTPDLGIDYIYVSSVTVSEFLVSVTLGCVLNGKASPLAAVSVERNINQVHRNLRLDSYLDGAVGWIVLGRGVINRVGRWVFSSPSNTRVLPRCLHVFTHEGVTSLKAYNSASELRGTVDVLSSDPQILRIYRDVRDINGTKTNCIVFGLNTLNESVDTLQRYVGECFNSPDSETCARSSIYSINHATPDCSGTVYIDIEEIPDNGMITPRRVGSNLFLDYLVGLGSVCDKFEVTTFPSKVDNCPDVDLEDRPLRDEEEEL